MARSDRYTRKILTSGDRSKWSDLYISDNNKIILGVDSDLQIYHDGTDNHIEATSALNIATANSGVAVKIGHSTSEVSISDNLTVTGDLTVNGTTTTINSTIQVGVDDTGHDVKFFGATSGRYLLWDESANTLKFTDATKVFFGTGDDLELSHDGSNSWITNFTGDLKIYNNANDGDIIFSSDDGSGGTTQYLRFDGGEGYTIVSKKINFGDNVRATFGASNDMQIHHDGSNNYIETNNAGHLYIQQNHADHDIIFQSDDGSGGTTAYLTLDGGVTRTKFAKPTQHADSIYSYFGDGDDLRIYHDGSNSHIANHTGEFRIESWADDLQIINYADDKDIIFQSDDGSGGVTAYLTLDGSTGENVFNEGARFEDYTISNDNATMFIGTGLDLRIYHNGSNSYISQEGTGDLYIRNTIDDRDIYFQSDDGSGGVATYFYLDGSSGRTIFPDTKYLVFGTDQNLFITHTGSDSYIQSYTTGQFYIDQYVDDHDLIFRCDDGSGGVTAYLTLDGSLGHTTVSKRIRFDDSVDGTFGAGNDLRLQHDGSHSYITNYTGNLYIDQATDDADLILQCDNGSGGLTPYITLDGSSTTIKIDQSTRVLDGKYLALGSGSDLQLSHDGSHSYMIQNGVGNLYIRQSVADADLILQCDNGSGGETAYITLDGSDTDIKVHKNFEIEKTLTMQHTADPSDPATGHSVMWSDTSGNLKVKINVGGSVVTRTLATGTD